MKRIVNIVHCHFESPAILRAGVRNLFFLMLCFLFSLSIIAQQNNSLRGKVLFLNSGNTPAVGVKVSGSIKIDSTTTLIANPVYTAADGSYTLIFPQAAPGHVVEIKVADKDGRGEALEIVNEEELRICRIPEDPTEEFEIIVCKKGERDAAAKRYYGILKTSADRELDKMKKEWSALVNQSEKDYETINTMSKRIDALQKQTDSLQLYKDALRIASINKDNATKRILRYLKLLDEGTSIQEARKELSVNKAIDELEVGILKFNAAVTELQTRATASKSIFDYKDAIRCYDTLINYAEKMGVDRLKIANYYNKIGIVILDDGSYDNSLEYFQKSMAIREEVLGSKHPDLAISYGNIAECYSAIGQHKKALEYRQKSIGVQEGVLDSKHPNLATSYSNIATDYNALGKYEKALEYCRKSIGILEEVLDPKHPRLAATYNSIATTYQYFGQYENALKYSQKSIDIREAVLDSKHPDLAICYNNIGAAYQALGYYKEALEYQQKGITIQEKILDSKHPALAISYDNIVATYQALGRYKIALDYYQKILYIFEDILDSKHPHLAIAYGNIALIYQDLGRYEKALEYQQKSLSIQEEVLDPRHPNLGGSYINIAVTYSKMKIFQKAKIFMEKCLAIFKEALPENHPHQKKALNTMAAIYYDSKDYESAITTYQKIAETFPEIKKEDFYSDIGLVYAKNKQFAAAKEAFAAYEKLFPKKGQTYRNWAMYYALQNEKEKALQNLKKAVELGYNNAEWLKTDDSMEGLRDEKGFIEIVQKLEKKHNKKKR